MPSILQWMMKTGEAAGRLPGLMRAAEHQTPGVHASSDEAVRRLLRIAGGLYLLFVVYGSLVPLEFQARPWGEAWQSFLNIFLRSVDFSPSPDRDANLLLYVPLGIFFAAWRASTRSANLLTGLAAVLACAAVSAAVEFAQIFLPLRTTSLTDIAANTLGGGAGVVLWHLLGGRLMARLVEMHSGGRHAARAMVMVYAAAYLAFSLFPYDFRIPPPELAQNFFAHWYRFLIDPASCASLLPCGAKLAAEIAAASPLGMLMGMMAGSPSARPSYAKAWIYGTLLGLLIEGGQFFVESGISQGISAFSRGAGVVLGLALFLRMQRHRSVGRWAPRPETAALGGAFYLMLLAALNGWFTTSWLGWSAAMQKAAEVRFVPFYYHYFTTETAALVSVLAYAAMYAPIGLGVWAWTAVRGGSGKGARASALLAAGAAFIIEGGKLFIANKRPDPTDLLIAASAAAGAFAVAALVSRWLSDVPAMPASSVATPPHALSRAGQSARVVSAVMGGLIGWAVLDYPLGPYWLGLGLALYAALSWRFPYLWLVAIPAMVPLLNLSPWTGRIFLDELDLVILTSIAVGLWRTPGLEIRGFTPISRWLFGLLAASFAISLAIGLLPLQALDHNAFSSYLSHYHSLRAAKGFLLACLLLPMLDACARDPEARWQSLFSAGMAVGAAVLGVVVLWERWLFPGLLDFSTEYRVTAFFADMQTGGPQVETWAVMALPFLASFYLAQPSRRRLIFSLLAFAAVVYAGLVTFARGGYLGLAVAMLVLAAGMLAGRGSQSSGARGRRRFAPAAALLVAIAVALPVISGSFIQSRFAQAGTDLGIRLAHWQSALAMMGPDVRSKIFGMGLGTFPAHYYLQNPLGIRPGNYRFEKEDGNVFLRLNPGNAYFVGQKAAVGAAGTYVLSLDLRSAAASPSKLDIHVCEKHVLYSFRCELLGFAATPDQTGWQHREQIFNNREVGRGGFFSGRPVVLAFASPGSDAAIEVDNVHLTAPDGSELLANGNFSNGADRWFFTTDNGWPWRVENLWLQFLFEQGWLGVILLGLLVVRQLYRLGGQVRRGDLFSLSLLASLSGVLAVGLFGSVLESPRLAMMFFVLMFAAELHASRRQLA